MPRYFNPKEIINYYYYKIGLNPHNNTILNAQKLLELIQNTRQIIQKHFCFNHGEISFQTCIHYAKLIGIQIVQAKDVCFHSTVSEQIFFKKNNLNNGFLQWEKNEITAITLASINEFVQTLNPDKTHFFWLVGLENLSFQALVNFITIIKQKIKKTTFFLDLSFYFYENYELLIGLVDGFFFNCEPLFNFYGTCLLGIDRKHYKNLTPITWGGGMNLAQTANLLSFKPYPAGFEGGTINPANIILVSKYFQTYAENIAEINLNGKLITNSINKMYNWSYGGSKFIIRFPNNFVYWNFNWTMDEWISYIQSYEK